MVCPTVGLKCCLKGNEVYYDSDTIWLSETNEETVVKTMKKNVFAGLDYYKEKAKKKSKEK